MPIPKPRANETQDDFISRCMGDDVMNSEYPDQKQRAAVCYSTWRDRKDDKMASLFVRKGDTYERQDMPFSEFADWFKTHSDDEGNVADDVMIYRDAGLKMSGEGIEWVMSDDTIDRDLEKIDQTGWDLKAFKNNPVLLWGHDNTRPAIGYVEKPKVKDNRLIGKPIFDPEDVDPFAHMIEQKVKRGTLRAGSVGFKPRVVEIVEDEKEAAKCKLIYRKQELREFSICNIPANPNATAIQPQLRAEEPSEDVQELKIEIEELRDELRTVKSMQMQIDEKKKSYLDFLLTKEAPKPTGLNSLLSKRK